MRKLIQNKGFSALFRSLPGVVVFFAAVSLALTARIAPPQEQVAPGPLSTAHSVTPGISRCSACHTPEYEIKPEKCLACHEEITRQAAAEKGYHKDKQEDCAVCHAEHQGPEAAFVPLDPEDFDHSETGTDLQGAHRKIEDCGLCHRPELSLSRVRTRSYILNDPSCRTCHNPPHPGHQDDCLTCHNKDTWIVDRGGLVAP